ncbi:MAG TPA: hypothetical protein VGI75_14520 [Pirellulales bacterium]
MKRAFESFALGANFLRVLGLRVRRDLLAMCVFSCVIGIKEEEDQLEATT